MTIYHVVQVSTGLVTRQFREERAPRLFHFEPDIFEGMPSTPADLAPASGNSTSVRTTLHECYTPLACSFAWPQSSHFYVLRSRAP
eukprot:6178861-Pleurochrysis_carterae.AAC.1